MLKATLFMTAATVATIFMVAPSQADQVRDHRCPDWQKDASGLCRPNIVVPPPPQGRPRPILPPVVVVRPPAPVPGQEVDGGRGFGQRPPVVNIDDGISCGEGLGIVRQHGYRRVRTVDCSGDIYTYQGTKRGRVMDIDVNLDGAIVDVYRP